MMIFIDILEKNNNTKKYINKEGPRLLRHLPKSAIIKTFYIEENDKNLRYMLIYYTISVLIINFNFSCKL